MGFPYLEDRVHLIYTNKVKYVVMHSIVMRFFFTAHVQFFSLFDMLKSVLLCFHI